MGLAKKSNKKKNEFVIDDCKNLIKNRRSDIWSLSSFYPNPVKSKEVGFLVRNVLGNKTKKVTQNIVTNEHVMIVHDGATGYFSMVLKPAFCNLLDQLKNKKLFSAFVFDPSGELYEMAKDNLKGLGINSYLLDFEDSSKSCSYNYLSFFWKQYQKAFSIISKVFPFKIIKSSSVLKSYTTTTYKCFSHGQLACENCYDILLKKLREKGCVNLLFNKKETSTNSYEQNYFSSEEECFNYKLSRYKKVIKNAMNNLSELYTDLGLCQTRVLKNASNEVLVAITILLLEINIASGGVLVTEEEFNLSTIFWILSNPTKMIGWLEDYKKVKGSENSMFFEIINKLNIKDLKDLTSIFADITEKLKIINDDSVREVISSMDIDFTSIFCKPTLLFTKLASQKLQTHGKLITAIMNQIYNEQKSLNHKKNICDSVQYKSNLTWLNIIDKFSALPQMQNFDEKLDFSKHNKIYWYMFFQSNKADEIFKIAKCQFLNMLVYVNSNNKVSEYLVKNFKNKQLDYCVSAKEIQQKPAKAIVVLSKNKVPFFSNMEHINEFDVFQKKKELFENKTFYKQKRHCRFNVFEFDSDKLNLNLINPNFYINSDLATSTRNIMRNFKFTMDPIEAISLNDPQIFELDTLEIFDSISVLIKKYYKKFVWKKDVLILLSKISQKILKIKIIEKKRKLKKVELAKLKNYYELFFRLNKWKDCL